MKQLEQQALALYKFNSRVRTHIICSGFLYGNGEQNDIFYEFFRCAWVSLHPQLAALPVVAGGNNHLPTIHVKDLANAVERTFAQGQSYAEYMIAVDQSYQQTQR